MRPDRWLGVIFLMAVSVFVTSACQANAQRSALIEGLIREVNMHRALNGVRALRLNAKLPATAQKHAEDMARGGFFDHQSPNGRSLQERVSSEGYHWQIIAENLSAGLSSPKATSDAWMTSPGHRDNMLHRYFNEAGVGYFRPSDKGKRSQYPHYWVILFATNYQ